MSWRVHGQAAQPEQLPWDLCPAEASPAMQTSAEVAPEQAVRMLQSTLPPALSRKQPDIEVSAVSPQLLLAPRSAGSVPSVLCARGTSLGDRVAFLSCSGPARLGARGTVVGVHEEDFEVLFDAPFDGGNDLQGRQVLTRPVPHRRPSAWPPPLFLTAFDRIQGVLSFIEPLYTSLELDTETLLKCLRAKDELQRPRQLSKPIRGVYLLFEIQP